jgi:hypothetical protein
MIETEMESFCKEHETSGEEVFQMIADVNAGNSGDRDGEELDNIEDDFVPQVIKLCDYAQFLNAMREAAMICTNNRIALEEERRAEEEGTGFNLSGCYYPRSDLIDNKQVNSYYIYTKCPWYFRKLFVAATNNIKDLTIQHDEDTFTILYTMPFFGRKRKQYPKDGKVHSTTNTWGKVQATTCFEEDGRVVIRVDNPAYAPEGYTTNTFEFSENFEGEKTVHWKRRIFTDKGTQEPAIDAQGEHAGTDLFCASSRENKASRK